MKIYYLALTAFLFVASSPLFGEGGDSAKADPETVLITYRVKKGQEAELSAVLARAWQTYQKEKLVHAAPHLILRDKEEGGSYRFIEIFTWNSPDAPDHAPDSVKQLWAQEQALCEARNGHGGIEGGEVDLLTK